MIKNTKEAQEVALTLCQATPPVVFHPDAPALSLRILMRGAKWPALPERADTAHVSPALIKTATPEPTTLAAVRISKINPNCAQPTDIQTASPSLPTNPDSDVTSAANFGGSDSDSDYFESAENSPTSPANTLDLAGNIRKLESTHEVLEGDINAIT